ncbi:lipid IV(A) 3-deoxy-D-manno-octulosonic acid transferase [Campylobacter mucosalis]|uniref:lipid IV(A) 3-deoxy-D-manno-octulosonic acid transferase n=1 Tax=Campylobacter mucosalis TaxID=202 RepID=UPI0014707969|nr:lipid IV(A) 3-deoxy-D-manno-octulosonic acid transferase [Campylobacter mucosalis]
MIIIYYILALIAWIFGAIFLLFFSLKDKYKISIPARFFLFKNPPPKPSKVHFHACSFGEIRALKPILEQFDDKLVSVITKTGFDEAKKICSNTRFLPFEIFLPFWLKKSEILVIFEAELWLMLVFLAKLKGTKVILINARISDRSYPRYKKFSFFYRYLFKFIDKVFAQSLLDKERLENLGPKNVVVSGNIKSAFLPKQTKIYTKPKERMIVFASTHKNEETMLLENITLSQNDKLIIAPRHPERFSEVDEIFSAFAKKFDFSYSKFSQSENFNAKCILIDSLGELINIYAISDIVVLGGSFVPNVGGHNPIEAAQFKNMIISGKYIFNQKALYSEVLGVKFIEPNEINRALNENYTQSTLGQIGSADEILKEIRGSDGESL